MQLKNTCFFNIFARKLHFLDLRLRNIYIITVVCFVLFVAIWALVMYYRKYIKRYIRLHIWPEVPTPDVYVQFNSSRPVDESAANDSAEQCDKNTTRSVFLFCW